MRPGKILLDVPQTYRAKNVLPGREHFILYLCQIFGWILGAEIGVRRGRTLYHLISNAPNLKMYAADRDISQFWTHEAQKRWSNRITTLEGRSWEVAQQVPDGCLDFYFIDAGHGYKSVIKDFDAWTPKLKPTGWLIGHDINFPAVNQAVKDRLSDFQVAPDNVWFYNPSGDYSILEKL